MNNIFITIYFLQVCCQVLAALPSPVNLTVESVNFEHNLRWDPGPGTPRGTTYKVSYSPCSSSKKLLLDVPDSSAAAVKQALQNCTQNVLAVYTIKVRAIHRGKASQWREKEFTPFTDTVLGPPDVSVSGCGDCLNLTMAPPRAKVELRYVYHVLTYRIHWKSAGDGRVWNTSTTQKRLVLRNLEPAVEYCVKVQLQLNTNQHTVPSGWVCAFTSPPSPSPVFPILGCVSGLLILGGLCLLGLIHTGVLCKLKTQLPRVLCLVEGHSYYYFDGEETKPDAVVCDAEGRGKGGGPGAQEEEEEEEEDEDERHGTGDAGYVNRMAGSQEGSSASAGSSNTMGSSSTADTTLPTTDTSAHSGVSDEEPEGEESLGGGGIPALCERVQEQQKTMGEPAGGDRERGRDRERGGGTERGGDVNLLSVLLAGGSGQGEAEPAGEPWGWQLPLLSTGHGSEPVRSGGALADRQAHDPELTPATPLLPLPDCEQTGTHYLQTRANWKEEEEEEEEDEEDEEHSGYIGR